MNINSNSKKNDQLETNQYIKFFVGEQAFGINVLESREILRAKDITEMPDSPDFIKGVINLRHDIVPIVSLKNVFDIQNEKTNLDEQNKVIIISIKDTLIGLEVKEVEGIIGVTSDELMMTPEIIKRYKKDNVNGVLNHNEELVIIINVKKMFSESEIKTIENEIEEIN